MDEEVTTTEPSFLLYNLETEFQRPAMFINQSSTARGKGVQRVAYTTGLL